VLAPQIAAPPRATIADWMAEIIAAQGADDFVISPTHLLDGFDDFVDLVVQELKRRGQFRLDCEGNTLRSYLRS